HGDDVAGQLELQRRVGTFPDHGEVDLGADGPPHDVHCLVQRHARDLGAVELDDEVVGEDAGARGRRVVDRGNDLDDALFHRHLDTEATELSGGVRLYVGIVDGLEIVRMRIERGQHAG